MLKNFDLYDYIFLCILGLSVYSISNLIGVGEIYSNAGIIQIILFLVFVLMRFDFKELFSYKFPERNIFLFEIYFILVVFLLSSFIFNLEYNIEPLAFIKILTYPLIFFVFFIYFAKKLYINEVFFESFLNLCLYIGLLHSVFSIFAFHTNFLSSNTYSNFTIGILSSPNTASFAYTILIPIAFYKFFSKEINLIVFSVFLTVFLYALLFTVSRAGYLSFFITAIIFSYAKSKKAFFVMLFFAVAAFLLVFIDFAFMKSDSTFSRALLYITSINMILSDFNHFLWGYGVKNGIDVFVNSKSLFGSFELVKSPHNFLFMLAIQFGALPTLAFFYFIMHIYIKIFFVKRKKELKEKFLKFNFCIALTVGLLIQNILEDILAHPEFFVMPFFLMFMGYLYYGILESKYNYIVKSI